MRMTDKIIKVPDEDYLPEDVIDCTLINDEYKRVWYSPSTGKKYTVAIIVSPE